MRLSKHFDKRKAWLFSDTPVGARASALIYSLAETAMANRLEPYLWLRNVLRALHDTGLSDTTRVIYTSDHGDNVGARGLWGKSTLYEESAGVPLIAAGPDIPAGRVIDTPVSPGTVHSALIWSGRDELIDYFSGLLTPRDAKVDTVVHHRTA